MQCPVPSGGSALTCNAFSEIAVPLVSQQHHSRLQVSVVATPFGRADAVSTLSSGEQVFALPAEGKLPIADFLQHLSRPHEDYANVLYIQQQNDCLRQEFAALLGDVCAEPEWALRIFGSKPDAVNIWIGNHMSQTSFHKDHYENLFAVIAGQKTFTLLPPADIYRLAIQEYPVAQYRTTGQDLRSSQLELSRLEGSKAIQWSPIDLKDDALPDKYPLFSDKSLPPPLKITVNAGEVLYLPSLWHHYVEQTSGPEGFCIAVNMWFDMAFDHRFAYFTAIEKMAAAYQSGPDESVN